MKSPPSSLVQNFLVILAVVSVWLKVVNSRAYNPKRETFYPNKNMKFRFRTLTDLILDVTKMGPCDKASKDGIKSIYFYVFEKPVILV